MYQKDKAPPSGLRPLPRGRHGLDLDQLRATRRARLIQAMLDRVALDGYAAATVPEVVAAARVSRNAFYEFFADKEDCFLSAMAELAGGLLNSATAFVAVGGDWRTALRGGMKNYLRWWQERPQLSRAYFVQMPTVGERAVEQRHQAYRPFEKMFAALAQQMRRDHPHLAPLPARVPRMVVIAVTEIVADEVRAGREARLAELENDLVYLIVNLLGGGAVRA